MLVVVLCIMGAILFYLPWTSIWEKNYFLSHFPFANAHPASSCVSGAVSGLGVLDIFLAINMIGLSPLLRHLPRPVCAPSNPLVRPISRSSVTSRPPRPAGGRAGRSLGSVDSKD